jgi:nucleoside-diphosphate-sugar epimerase
MIISVTGASGFIGKKLMNQHLKLGNQVSYLTRTVSRPRANAKAIVADLNSPIDQLIPLLAHSKTLYHCAGELQNESVMHSTHVLGTINLLNAVALAHATNKEIFHWIQLSSCGAYGQPSTHSSIARFVDELTPDNPYGEYECTKTEADKLIIDFAKNHDWFKYTIIRPTNVFGVGMRSTAIKRIAKLIKSRLFFYVGNKNAIANFVHVDDVVEAMVLSAKLPHAYNQTFIVSNDCKFSDMVDALASALRIKKPNWVVNEFLLRQFVRLCGTFIKLPITNTQIDVMMRQTHYRNAKLVNALNWAPSNSAPTQLKQYISDTFDV